MKQYKLVSINNTLLGTVTVPDEWFNAINQQHGVRAAMVAPINVRKYNPTGKVYALEMQKCVTLRRAYFSDLKDALFLMEGTIEQLEEMPECHFSPSMAYMKSLIKEGL